VRPGPQRKEATVDTVKSSAPYAYPFTEAPEERPCFSCLERWVFLGSLDYDGEEITEAIRCRRCNGSVVLAVSETLQLPLLAKLSYDSVSRARPANFACD
jgi:hypothetical protein